MKTVNIKYAAYAIMGSIILESKFFVTEAAKNNWCNKIGRKYNGQATVEVYRYDASCMTEALLETWNA